MIFGEEVSLGYIYMGTLIGAGFATGREIMSFFTIYGLYGLLGIILACVLFFFLGYFILKQAIRHQSGCIRDILLPIAGEKLMLVFEVFTDFFCLAGFYIMMSGCGAVFCESMNLPYLPTVIFLSIGNITALKRGLKSIANYNKFLVSVMLFLTFLITIFCLKANPDIINKINIIPAKKGWAVSALLYVSYNMTLALVVLVSLGTYTTRIKAAFGAALFGAGGLLVMAIFMWFITVINFFSLINVEVPLLAVTQQFGMALYMSSVIILLSAMVTTALGLGFSFAQSFSYRYDINYHNALNILYLGLPFVCFGFSNMVETIYPLFGILGISFGILLIIRRFFKVLLE